MSDGFYTNDEDDGCFGGYGSDGAWAYADNGGYATERAALEAYRTPVMGGGFRSGERGEGRRRPVYDASGSGGYGRAA